jgi:nucleoside-diphosphate-sugar epimerase
MYVAITGGTGFIGSHCVARAVASGHRVRMLVRNPGKARTALDLHGVDRSAVDVVVADLTDHPALRAGLEGVDAVLHVAALFSFKASDGAAMRQNNPASTEVILDAARDLGLDPVVYVSTIGVFMPPLGSDLSADDDLSTGCGPYTDSKIAAEQVARRHQAEGAPVTCVYPGGVIGPSDPSPDLSDSMGTLRDLLRGSIIPFPAEIRMGWVDVRDVARVCVGALEPGRGPRRYLVSGDMVAMGDVTGLFTELTGRSFRHLSPPAPVMLGLGHAFEMAGRLLRRRLPLNAELGRMFAGSVRSGGWKTADQSAATEFGYPGYTLEETLGATIRWLHANGHFTDRHAGHLAG